MGSLNEGPILFIAGRGELPENGLHRYHRSDGTWQGAHVAAVSDLAALARHPSRQVLYGVAGVEEGTLHSWAVSGESVQELEVQSTGGREPCHVSVDPAGRFLTVSNYASGTLAIQRLGSYGDFQGETQLIHFSGHGSDAERQDASHPHQAVFHGNALHVVDLGADCVRHFVLSSEGTEVRLQPTEATPLPSGTGPRHLTFLPNTSFVLSGELTSTVLMHGPLASGREWFVLPSTHRTGPARTRHDRNYPGDIQSSPDGTKVYCANRGYDTISTFEVHGAELQMVSEQAVAAAWPQHLLVFDDELFIASCDSSLVSTMPLVEGIPQATRHQFECQNASWLLGQPIWWR